MLKKVNYLIGIILIITGCSVYESVYQDNPLNIDGSSSDWTTTLDSKDNNSYSYGISNDSENLYIRININDRSIQKKLIFGGLTIWIDTTGKKKENLGITCPVQKTPLSKMDRNKMDRKHDSPLWDNNQILAAEFIGFDKSMETYYITNNPYEIEVSIDQDEFKSLYYEMKIPFKAIYSDFSELSQKTLSIGLETGTLKMPSQNSRPAEMTSQPSSMSRGGPGGGPGGGRGGGGPGGRGSGMSGSGEGGSHSGEMPNSSDMTDLTTPTKFWIKNILLAKSKIQNIP